MCDVRGGLSIFSYKVYGQAWQMQSPHTSVVLGQYRVGASIQNLRKDLKKKISTKKQTQKTQEGRPRRTSHMCAKHSSLVDIAVALGSLISASASDEFENGLRGCRSSFLSSCPNPTPHWCCYITGCTSYLNWGRNLFFQWHSMLLQCCFTCKWTRFLSNDE